MFWVSMVIGIFIGAIFRMLTMGLMVTYKINTAETIEKYEEPLDN